MWVGALMSGCRLDASVAAPCVSPMSSGGRESSRGHGRRVALQGVEHDSGGSAFEASQGFCLGVAHRQPLVVVGPASAVALDLCQRDAVQGGVELAVACAVEPDPTAGAARPHRHRGGTGVHGEPGLVGEPPVDACGLTDDLGRPERTTARQLQQGRRAFGDQVGDLSLQRALIRPVRTSMSSRSSPARRASIPLLFARNPVSSTRLTARFKVFGPGSTVGSMRCRCQRNRLTIAVRCLTRSSR